MTEFTQDLLTHLWESTLFGVACCLLIIAFGKTSSYSRHLLAWASIVTGARAAMLSRSCATRVPAPVVPPDSAS